MGSAFCFCTRFLERQPCLLLSDEATFLFLCESVTRRGLEELAHNRVGGGQICSATMQGLLTAAVFYAFQSRPGTGVMPLY